MADRAVESHTTDRDRARTGGRRVPAPNLRVVIEGIHPEIDGGRFPIKRTPGERVVVQADIFADGHDVIAAVLRDRHVNLPAGESEGPRGETRRVPEGAGSPLPDAEPWRETPMTADAPASDRWTAHFEAGPVGWHEYAIVAWVDRFRSWQRDLELKAAAGQGVTLELLEGVLLVREAAARAEQIASGRADANWLLAQADAMAEATPDAERVRVALSGPLGALMDAYADRSHATTSTALRVRVDRERARWGAWYEMFPRSAGSDPSRSATFAEACHRLPAIADLGFDVVYLPPIHPIGRTFRKGRNNTPEPRADDPGSPWAIGSADGGHTAIEPSLGTFDDFAAFRDEAERLGLELALDLAFQCSPDHPWVRAHPEWFRHRPDGTIKYAENPPKKYQDIYPLDFACDDWRALWRELLEVTLFWIERGIRIFRVDNPHTKAFGFWEWFIREIHRRDPHVIFLAEAFTRPKPMRFLAKLGFTQSYTYFTWRNTKSELVDYFTELTATDVREYFRPNLFTNTPDILHAYLQHGGPPAFRARLLLAATLGASYGIYSGFELCEGLALPGTEEYANSEKYQIRAWDWNRPGNIKELITQVNRVRRRYRALQFTGPLRFHATDNQEIIAYSKAAPGDGSEPAGAVDPPILIVVNLDPHHMQHGFVQVPEGWLAAAGPGGSYTVRDLLDDSQYTWRSDWNYVRFDPDIRQGHILKLEV
jgi:starch synthase (maltosyl-transferring)